MNEKLKAKLFDDVMESFEQFFFEDDVKELSYTEECLLGYSIAMAGGLHEWIKKYDLQDDAISLRLPETTLLHFTLLMDKLKGK